MSRREKPKDKPEQPDGGEHAERQNRHTIVHHPFWYQPKEQTLKQWMIGTGPDPRKGIRVQSKDRRYTRERSKEAGKAQGTSNNPSPRLPIGGAENRCEL